MFRGYRWLLGCALLSAGCTSDATADRLAALEAQNAELVAELRRGAVAQPETSRPPRIEMLPPEVFDRPGGPPVPMRPAVEAAADPDTPPELRDYIATVAAQRPGGFGPPPAPPTSTLSANSGVLRNSTWVTGTTEEGVWTTLQFGETLLSITHAGQPMQTQIADYGGSHAACLGMPLCVAGLTPDGTFSVQHFHLDGDRLYPVQCLEWSQSGDGALPPSDDAIRANSGNIVVRRDGRTLCLRHEQAAPYVRLGTLLSGQSPRP